MAWNFTPQSHNCALSRSIQRHYGTLQHPRRLRLRSCRPQTPKSVVYGLLKVLFATEISLGGEDRRVSEQELNLFYLSAGSMAQLCTGSAQIVGSKVVQLHPFSTPPNHVPDDILRDALAPRSSMSA